MRLGAGAHLRRVLRRPAAASFRGLLWLTMQAQFAAALFRSRRDFVRARHQGSQMLVEGGKVAVFAHFDRDGCVHDVVLHYLVALGQAGFTVVFVSNAPRLPADALGRVLPHAALVLHRWNVGYDFAAYKDGLMALGPLTQFEQVVLANDSVYGPLFDLGAILRRCDDRADVWGMTDSQERQYHLQSYFLLFRRPALASPALAAFWRAVRPVQSRQWIIRRYEIGLTQALRRTGLRCTALFPCEDAIASFVTAASADRASCVPSHVAATLRVIAQGRPINVMHVLWDHLISRLGCPFIKRELLVYNPLRVPQVCKWPEVVRHASGYDIDLIARHLQTQRPHDPPRTQDA